MRKISISFNLYDSVGYVVVRDEVGRTIDMTKITDDTTAMRDWWLVVFHWTRVMGWRIVKMGVLMGDVDLEGDD